MPHLNEGGLCLIHMKEVYASYEGGLCLIWSHRVARGSWRASQRCETRELQAFHHQSRCHSFDDQYEPKGSHKKERNQASFTTGKHYCRMQPQG